MKKFENGQKIIVHGEEMTVVIPGEFVKNKRKEALRIFNTSYQLKKQFKKQKGSEK